MILFEGLSAVRRARIVPEATAQALAAAVKSAHTAMPSGSARNPRTTRS